MVTHLIDTVVNCQLISVTEELNCKLKKLKVLITDGIYTESSGHQVLVLYIVSVLHRYKRLLVTGTTDS